jgi:outer membrane protein TolC
LSIEIPLFRLTQHQVARWRVERDQLEAEWETRLSEARADVVCLTKEIELVERQVDAAGEAADSASRLADLARTTAESGALDALVAADISERAFAARLRKLTIEQFLVELHPREPELPPGTVVTSTSIRWCYLASRSR